jgi:penicillin-binding protein A
MQKQIRKVGLGLVLAFLAVFFQLNYVQIFAAERIAGNNANVRSLLREYSIKRGDIITLDGTTVAKSEPTGGRLAYRRTYPEGDLYAHITGFYSINYG